MVTTHLLADIGGTRARFALTSGARIGPIDTMLVADHASPAAAFRHFLDRHDAAANVSLGVVAAAGPVEDGRCALTNASWVLDAAELAHVFGLQTVRIVNDLAALAWAVPHLGPADVEAVGDGREVAAAPVVVIAPGTGLGMASLIREGGRTSVLAGEGGHVTLAATGPDEAAIIETLRRRHGHVSAERVLSGGGLTNLYAALAELDGQEEPALAPAEITRMAVDGSSPRARRALDAFCAFLGSVAGNAALMLGARGGVYVGGGIVPRIVDYLRHSAFRRQFEDKGRFDRYLTDIPTRVIVRDHPAFLGLKALADLTAADAADGKRPRS